jgi:hypothetical protein
MLLPAGLRVLGAYAQARSGDAAAVQGVADALVAAVPAQQVWHLLTLMSQASALRICILGTDGMT